MNAVTQAGRIKKYDLAVWGATGCTGSRVIRLLQKELIRNPSLNILLISRSAEKLNLLLTELNANSVFSISVANSDNYDEAAAISQDTKIVLSCVGPYTTQGSYIVKSCAENGTDYVDISGESLWIKQMITEYHEKARETGARIIFSCGFDSVPSDLSVYFLQNTAHSVFGHPIPCIKGRIQRMKTVPLSASTLAAHQLLMNKASQDASVLSFLVNPFGLTPGFTGPEQPPIHTVKFDDELGRQAAPFWGAGINRKTIHRSNQLLNFLYGRDFCYDEMVSVDPDGHNAALIQELGQFPSTTGITEPIRDAQQDNGSWLIFWHGLLDGKEVIRVSMSGQQDPGYATSAALVVEAALCLLDGQAVTKGGIATTASCLGQSLLNRLNHKKIIDISWAVLPPT